MAAPDDGTQERAGMAAPDRANRSDGGFRGLIPSPDDLRLPSVLSLILVNLVPLYGVTFLGWQVFPILLLYWFESLVIGCLNVAKMAMASAGKGPLPQKFFLIPFFIVHYGMFTAVHGLFLFSLFGDESLTESVGGFPAPQRLFQQIAQYKLGLPIALLALSHGISFFYNFIGKEEYKRVTPKTMMMRPYGRVFLLHVTIILGAFLLIRGNTPVAGLAVLVILKTLLDVGAHLRERSILQRSHTKEERP